MWIFLTSALCAGCSPYYTWGYGPTVHPEATEAYIHAVMARENGDYETAVTYYDAALRRTYSEKVAKEREETLQLANE